MKNILSAVVVCFFSEAEVHPGADLLFEAVSHTEQQQEADGKSSCVDVFFCALLNPDKPCMWPCD